MPDKRYVAALKRTGAEAPPQDWQDKLSKIRGVSIIGASQRRVQFTAEPEAAERVRSELGDYLHVEELVERRF
jgi:hypothetical protein